MSLYTIANDELEVILSDFGATIVSVKKKDDDLNLVAAYQHEADYAQYKGPYLNAVVGPYAGRIGYGQIGQRQFSINNGCHHLHGGQSTTAFQTWQVIEQANTKLVMKLSCRHDEDGYRGEFNYQACYELDQNSLILTLDCQLSEDNPMSLTNHLYINLNGDYQSGLSQHQLHLPSQKKTHINSDGVADGLVAVDGIFDFNQFKGFAGTDPEFEITRSFDTAYLLDGPIELKGNHHQLTIETSAPAAVIYSANYFDEKLPLEKPYLSQHSCLAIECQNLPNGINYGFDQWYGPNRAYHQWMKYTWR